MRKLGLLLACILVCMGWSREAHAVLSTCTVTGVVYRADNSAFANGNITFRPVSTQPFGGDTVAIPGITVTTDGSGNIPAGTLFPQGERMTIQVGKDKPLGVVIPSGGSCPVTFGALYASGLSGLPPGFGPLTGTFPIQVSAPPNPTASLANVTAEQGTGPKVQLSTGTTTTNDCVKFDANGNTVDAGAGCGAGSGTGLVNKVFNVTDVAYGALGNDTGDDKPAIQAAIAAAGAANISGINSAQTYLPAGVYRTNSPVVVGHSTSAGTDPSFVGAGYLQTYLDAHFIGPAIVASTRNTYPTFDNVSVTSNIIPSGSGTSLTWAANGFGGFDLNEVLAFNNSAYPETGPFNGLAQWDIRLFMRDDDTASTHCIWASDGGLNVVASPGLTSFTVNIGAMGYLCIDGADQKLKGSLNVNGTEIRVNSGATTVTQGTVYEVELNLDASHNVNLYMGTGGTVTRVAQVASGGTTIKQRADESNYLGAEISTWPESGVNFLWRGAIQSTQISNLARNTAASYTEDSAQFTSDANTYFLMNNGLSNFPSGQPIVQVDKGNGNTGPWWISFRDLGNGCCGGQQQLRDFQVIGSATIGILANAKTIDAERTPVVLTTDFSYAGIFTTANSTFGSTIKTLPAYPVTQATLSPLMILGGISTVSDVNLQASNYPLVLSPASNAKNVFFQTNNRVNCAIVSAGASPGGASTFDLMDADSENGGDFPWYCSQNAIEPVHITNSFISDGSPTAASSPFVLYGVTGKLTLDHNEIILPGGYAGTSIVDATNAHGGGGQQPATANALVTFLNNDFDNANLHQEVPPAGVSYTNNGLAYDAKGARTTFADFEIPSIPQLTSNILDGSCTSPCSVTLPANIPQGQVIVIVFNFGTGATPSAPVLNSAGWTQGCAFDDHNSSFQNYITMWKVAGANDAGASVSFTFGGGGSSRDEHVAVVSNLNQYNPIGTCFTSTQASSTTFTLGGGTITNRNSRVLATVGNQASVGETPTSPPTDFLKLDSLSTVPTWLYLPRSTTAPSITFSAGSSVNWSGLQMELLPDSPQTTLAPFSAGVPPIYYGASYPLLRGVDLNGRDTVECNDNGTVTTSQNVIFTTNSCQKFTTATTGLTYTLQTAGIKTGQQVEIDSYITGAITGPLWATSSGAFKWLGGGPPTSSGTNGFVDLLYLKYDGVNWLETGESFGLH